MESVAKASAFGVWMGRRVTLCAASTIICVLAGCTATRTDRMIPDIKASHTHPYSVQVGHAGDRVRTDSALDPIATSYFGSTTSTYVDSNKFMEAVAASVQASHIFREVVSNEAADYRLDVNIISDEEPSPGVQMKSTLVVSWRLTRAETGIVVAHKIIDATHKATPLSFVGVRSAVEGAVRDNIRMGIELLTSSQLDVEESVELVAFVWGRRFRLEQVDGKPVAAHRAGSGSQVAYLTPGQHQLHLQGRLPAPRLPAPTGKGSVMRGVFTFIGLAAISGFGEAYGGPGTQGIPDDMILEASKQAAKPGRKTAADTWEEIDLSLDGRPGGVYEILRDSKGTVTLNLKQPDSL